MAKLDPRIEVIRDTYGLADSDFWELPQKKGTWVARHAALETAAVKAKITFENPVIVEANSEAGIAVISVRGFVLNDSARSEWSLGEASPKNNKNAYPWAMAEKRAKDRVIIKLIGINGLVYSEDEMSEPEGLRPPTVPARQNTDASLGGVPGNTTSEEVGNRLPKAKARDLYERLQKALDERNSALGIESWFSNDKVQAAVITLPVDWEEGFRGTVELKYKTAIAAETTDPAVLKTAQQSLDDLEMGRQ